MAHQKSTMSTKVGIQDHLIGPWIGQSMANSAFLMYGMSFAAVLRRSITVRSWARWLDERDPVSTPTCCLLQAQSGSSTMNSRNELNHFIPGRHYDLCLFSFWRTASLVVVMWLLLFSAGWVVPAVAQSSGDRSRVVIDDFESYEDGRLPTRWRAQLNGELVSLTSQFFNDKEWFKVTREEGNGFVRAFADGATTHINMDNGADFEWDTTIHPVLAWDWRAIQLPEGSREDEDRRNDSGAGVYIVFSIDGVLIKRPKIIKYVYSASLPVGTTVSYGKLKVIVAASARDGSGSWHHVERDVVADYRRVFGEDPPRRPLRLRLWSDSDNTGTVATADFDNILLLGAR
jgi:hypothetical protein